MVTLINELRFLFMTYETPRCLLIYDTPFILTDFFSTSFFIQIRRRKVFENDQKKSHFKQD